MCVCVSCVKLLYFIPVFISLYLFLCCCNFRHFQLMLKYTKFTGIYKSCNMATNLIETWKHVCS